MENRIPMGFKGFFQSYYFHVADLKISFINQMTKVIYHRTGITKSSEDKHFVLKITNINLIGKTFIIF